MKRRINLKLSAICLFVLILLGCILSGDSQAGSTQINSPNPKVVSAKDIPRIVKGLPGYAKFSYSGLAFFDGKLYASSNIGLIEYKDGTLSRLYMWYDRDDVVSGPWIDRANQSLWILHEGTNKLIRFDGKNWSLADLPRSKEGFSRGDMLNGFQGISTDTAFWLQGGNHAWRADASKMTWVNEPIPDNGSFVSIAPLKDKILVLMRQEYIPYLPESPSNRPDKPETDARYFMQNGQWQELPDKSEIKFLTEDIIVGKEAVYILTQKDELLRLSSNGLTSIPTPGKVEVMTITTSGNLLVSFRNDGIYEYTGKWQKRFLCPYRPTEPAHWAYLAEDNGQVAFAIDSKPQMTGDGRFKYPGQTTLWIALGNELKVVPLRSQ